MKRWLLLLLLLLLPASALAAGKLTLEAEPGLVTYQFSLKDKEYAVIQYRTGMESGQTVIDGMDGQFSGAIHLDYTPEGGRVTIKVLDTKQNQLLDGTVHLPAQPNYQPPTGKGFARVSDLSLTSTAEGFSYRFRADGAEQLRLNAKSRSQSVAMLVTPDADGWFIGDVSMPLVYAYTTIQVTVQSANGKDTLAQQETRRDYTPIEEVPQAEEGRLKGVIVCVDAGHQLKTQYIQEPIGPGLEGVNKPVGGMAQGKVTGRLEHMVTLEVANVLRNELHRQGATVLMTRTEIDQFVSNIDRDNTANDGNAHIMLRLHCDSGSSASKYGISIHAPSNSAYARAIATKEEYMALGRILLDDMRNACSVPIANHTGHVVLTDKFVGNNWAKMLCFLVEMGYMTNASDDILLSTPHYQQRLAEGMCQAVYDIAIQRGWLSE